MAQSKQNCIKCINMAYPLNVLSPLCVCELYPIVTLIVFLVYVITSFKIA